MIVLKFKNSTKLDNDLNIAKVTADKYLNSDQVYDKKYRFKVN